MAVTVGFGIALAGAVQGDAADFGGMAGASGAAALATGAPLPLASLPPPLRASSPEVLALGKRMYEDVCFICHGKDGRGDGEAAHFLNPKPRDFVAGKFALVSTWEGVPTDQDLFRTISRGMPGSAMPGFRALPEEERWGLVYYVKSFAENPLQVQPATERKGDGQPGTGGIRVPPEPPQPNYLPPGLDMPGTGVIRVPPEPPFTPEARARALELYTDACAGCHGKTGKGDGVADQRDEKGNPTQPRDFTLGIFKGSPDPTDLYRRIIAGMPGTPMPMNDWAYGDDAWHLVHLIRSWSSPAPATGRCPFLFCIE